MAEEKTTKTTDSTETDKTTKAPTITDTVAYCPHCGGELTADEVTTEPAVLIECVAKVDCQYQGRFFEKGETLVFNVNITKEIPVHFEKIRDLKE